MVDHHHLETTADQLVTNHMRPISSTVQPCVKVTPEVDRAASTGPGASVVFAGGTVALR